MSIAICQSSRQEMGVVGIEGDSRRNVVKRHSQYVKQCAPQMSLRPDLNDAQVVANVVRLSVIRYGIFTSDASSYPRAWPAVQEGGRHERREQTVRIK